MRSVAPGARDRRYQVTAALLTYTSFTVAMIAALLGASGAPAWAYLFFPLGPVFLLFFSQVRLALLLLFFAAIGIRWAWSLLTPHTLEITGPETHRNSKSQVASRKMHNSSNFQNLLTTLTFTGI
jgi:hypothetical protein